MVYVKVVYVKLVQCMYCGQIVNVFGVFDIDLVFKLVGDDVDFFYCGVGGCLVGRGFDLFYFYFYGNIIYVVNLFFIKIVCFKDYFGWNWCGGFYYVV